MVRRGGNFRRNNRGNRRVSRRRRGSRKNLAFSGAMLQAPINPKATSFTPWNTCVLNRGVTIANDTAFTVTATYIRDALINQLNLPTAVGSLSFRFMAVEMYDLAGRPLEVQLLDPFSPKSSSLVTGIDFPGRAGWARVRLVWPKAVSANTYAVASTNDATVIIGGSVGSPVGASLVAGTKVLLKIRVLWRIESNKVPDKMGFFAVCNSPISLPLESKDVCITNDAVIDDETIVNDEMGSFEHLKIRD